MKTLREVLSIVKEEDLLKEFGEFEAHVDEAVKPLRKQLSRDVRTTEVASLQDHMTDVERWRERIVRYLALASAFVEHCKSSHFILDTAPGGKRATEFERTAYQKKLSAGFRGLEVAMEGLVKSVDSRVNLCKKLLGDDGDGR